MWTLTSVAPPPVFTVKHINLHIVVVYLWPCPSCSCFRSSCSSCLVLLDMVWWPLFGLFSNEAVVQGGPEYT